MDSLSAKATVWVLASEPPSRSGMSNLPRAATPGSGSGVETFGDARAALVLARGESVSECDPDLGALHPAAKVPAVDLDRAWSREIRGHHIFDFDLDIVSHRLQGAAYVGRYARVDLKRFALVMDARTARGVLRSVAIVDRVHDGLHDRDPMKALRTKLRGPAQILEVEQAERPRDRRTPGQPRERDDAMAPVIDHLCRRCARLVRREVLARQDATKLTDVVGDGGGELAVIEHLRALARDRFQRSRKIGLDQAVRGLETRRRPVRRAALTVVHALCFGVLVKPNGGRAKDERPVPIHHEAVAREADRGFEETRPRQLAQAPMRELIGGDRARHRGRKRPLDVGIVLHRRPSVHARPSVAAHKLEHLGPRRERRARRSIERARFPFAPHHESRDPAEPASDRRRDTERECARECGVERIATLAQDLDPSLCGEGIRGHHAAGRDGFGLGENPLAAGRLGHLRRSLSDRMDAADLLAFKTIPELDTSPDGTRVAYVVTWIDTEKDEYRSTIHVAPTEAGTPVEFTRGPTRDSAPRWSQDGAQLAFLSDRTGGERQIFVMSARCGEPRQLTSVPGHAEAASWSPDGTKIAFSGRVWVEPRPEDATARARWEQRPRHITKAQYKTDGHGYTFDARSHLFIVDLGTGETKQLTDGDSEDRAESWSPDGRQIAFARTRGGRGEYAWRGLWSADVASGAARRITENV